MSIVERRENEKRAQAMPTETAQESYGKITKTDIQRERSLRLFFFSACGNNRPNYG